MGRHRLLGGQALLALVLLSTPLWTAPIPTDTPEAKVAALANRIDQLIAKGYADRKIIPAPLTEDAEFLRRVYLDLTGRIPSVSEVHRFLKSKDPEKRRQLVDDLLASHNYVNHFATVWQHAIIPPSNNQQNEGFAVQVETWMKRKLRDEVPYNQIVRDLLTNTTPTAMGQMQIQVINQVQQVGADQGSQAFYQANENKPENLAAASSRLFLGVKLECAQCHDHPFARWTRNQFWELAAFYVETQPNNRQMVKGMEEATLRDGKREITIPGTSKVVQAKYLDGKQPDLSKDPSSRKVLADWITSKDNPFFAKAIVNRYWAHFFGVGLNEPIDEVENDENPASHPELLNELADAFVKSNYDLKFLIRAIVNSRTYQLSSGRLVSGQDDPRAFGRMALKGLSGEQLFDSLCQATGFRNNARNAQVNVFGGIGTPRSEFLARFDNSVDKKTEYQTSILQALALMNGKLVADVTSLERSQTLHALLDSPFLTNRQRLDTLYLTTLGRPMRVEEESRLVRYVEAGGPTKNPSKALADVFWVLLNSSEFCLNH